MAIDPNSMGAPGAPDQQQVYKQESEEISTFQHQGAMQSGFQLLLGPFATSKEIAQAINTLLQSVVNQVKKDQEDAVNEIKRLRQIEEGQDPG
jgi:hypothetical protein